MSRVTGSSEQSLSVHHSSWRGGLASSAQDGVRFSMRSPCFTWKLPSHAASPVEASLLQRSSVQDSTTSLPFSKFVCL